jgi:hypothetical protein
LQDDASDGGEDHDQNQQNDTSLYARDGAPGFADNGAQIGEHFFFLFTD